MNYNYGLGRITTTFMYFLEGIVAIVVALFWGTFHTSLIVTASAFWLGGLVILLLVQPSDKKRFAVYNFCQISLITLISVWLSIVFGTPQIFFLMLFLQWISNLLFFNKSICRSLLYVHILTMVLMTYVFYAFSNTEFICALIVLICANWFTGKMNDIVHKQEKRNLDQQQSLDDMLELVDAKYEEARLANHAKSSFLANMSHEIRTPINTVLGLDTMILRESKEENVKNYALDIQSAGQSLLALINDILDFSKIESGKMEIIPVDYDLTGMIRDVHTMLSDRVAQKGLQFTVKVDEKLPFRLMGDDVRIKQILVNLLTNAVKYTKEGSVCLALDGEISGPVLKLHCSVRDTGVGIKKENLNQLFDEFVRIDEKKNRNIEGTGLGINIVTNLLNLMGSELEVESVYGEGSLFQFTILQGITNSEPIGNWEVDTKERAEDYRYTTEFTVEGARFLVVDDNRMNRMVFTHLLKDLKCQIDEADSGARCLELAKEKKYDLIFMDHMMPEMDGVETFAKMRENTDEINADTPVIILTANAVSGAREQYLEMGFDGYLSKPIIPDDLEKLIYTMLKEKVRNVDADAEQAETAEQTGTLPEVEGVDYDYALLKLKSADLVENVVKDYVTTAKSDAKQLQQMADQIGMASDEETRAAAFDAYRVKVHAMKTNAAMLGALGVSSLARLLEFAARDRDWDTIEKLDSVFGKEWLALENNLRRAYGYAEPVKKGKTIEQAMLLQYLELLKKAMEELDTDTADSIMEELQNYDYDEKEEQIFEELAAAVRNLDIALSVTRIEEWKTK